MAVSREPEPNEHDVEAQTAAGEMISPAEARFERLRKRAGVVLAPTAFVVAWLLTPESAGEPARRLAGVLAGVAMLWITETLPLPVTSLLGAVLCIVLGVAPADVVLAPFADKIRCRPVLNIERQCCHGTEKPIYCLPWHGH